MFQCLEVLGTDSLQTIKLSMRSNIMRRSKKSTKLKKQRRANEQSILDNVQDKLTWKAQQHCISKTVNRQGLIKSTVSKIQPQHIILTYDPKAKILSHTEWNLMEEMLVLNSLNCI